MKVFISVGRASTPRQRQFLERLEKELFARRLQPCIIGRNAFTSGKPLAHIKRELRDSNGLLALVFDRLHVDGGRELQLDAEPLEIAEPRHYGSAWHHAEIGMASVLDLPVFVIREKPVWQDAMLEEKHDWYVYPSNMDEREFDTKELDGRLGAWVAEVEKFVAAKAKAEAAQPPVFDPEKTTPWQLFRGYTFAQWAKVGAFLGPVAAFIFGAGVWWTNLNAKSPATSTTEVVQAGTLTAGLPAAAISRIHQARSLAGRQKYVEAWSELNIALEHAPMTVREKAAIRDAVAFAQRGEMEKAVHTVLEVFAAVP